MFGTRMDSFVCFPCCCVKEPGKSCYGYTLRPRQGRGFRRQERSLITNFNSRSVALLLSMDTMSWKGEPLVEKQSKWRGQG